MELNPCSAIVVALSLSLSSLLINLRVLSPVSNRGEDVMFGSGIQKLPNKLEAISDINLTLEIVASAPLVSPTKIISSSTHPK